MRLQVLLATMNQSDNSILEKMNIRSDIIIGNQCSKDEVKEETYGGHTVKWLSFAEKGVGLNRNNTLMRADADIGLIADDDVVYVDEYVEIITSFFEKHMDADVVVFNMKVKRGDSAYKDIVHSTRRIGKKAAAFYGAYCMAVRIESIRYANVFFHLQFGGGCRYSCGEDTIFLNDCLRNGLRVYSCKETIGSVDHGSSTWFNGYCEKYFRDKGVVYKKMHPHTYRLIALYNSVKHRKLYKQYGWWNAFITMSGF